MRVVVAAQFVFFPVFLDGVLGFGANDAFAAAGVVALGAQFLLEFFVDLGVEAGKPAGIGFAVDAEAVGFLVGFDGVGGGGGWFAVGGTGVVTEEVQSGLESFGVGAAVLVFLCVFVLYEPVGDVFVAVQGGEVVGGEAAGVGDVQRAFFVAVFFEGVQFAFARGAQCRQAFVATGVGFFGRRCGGFGRWFAAGDGGFFVVSGFGRGFGGGVFFVVGRFGRGFGGGGFFVVGRFGRGFAGGFFVVSGFGRGFGSGFFVVGGFGRGFGGVFFVVSGFGRGFGGGFFGGSRFGRGGFCRRGFGWRGFVRGCVGTRQADEEGREDEAAQGGFVGHGVVASGCCVACWG